MAAPSTPAMAAPLLSSALGWLLWSLLVGGLANRLPADWLASGRRARGPGLRWESPQLYERRLAIRRWKPWLPDAGDALPGGVRKASLARRDPERLARLEGETRRAELVHWGLWPFWIITALWLPPAGVLINLAFATVFNLPCVLVQRYNRLRLARTLGRWRG
jgi:glycosyl-4,4'-diaponeurosporenoate acyltransferase